MSLRDHGLDEKFTYKWITSQCAPDVSRTSDCEKQMWKERNSCKTLKDVYQRCVDHIERYKFDVHHVEFFPAYDNGNEISWIRLTEQLELSGIGGEGPLFLFVCSKGNYEFKIYFWPDCCCKGGIFRAIAARDKISKEKKLDLRADFFCQNGFEVEVQNFLKVVNEGEDVFEKLYGKCVKFDHFCV